MNYKEMTFENVDVKKDKKTYKKIRKLYKSIEEDKKIKKLKHAKEDDIFVNGKSLLDKINEIIDVVNELKEEE